MRKYFAFILLSIIIIFFGLKPVQATTLDDCNQNPIPSDKAADCIEIITQKVSDLGSQKKTLATQIAQFDSQIQLTQLKIVDAQATVEKLEKEIGVLGFRIGYINESVDRLETLLKERIIATYQQGFVSNLEILVTSRDFSDLILRTQYLKQVQENDKKILSNLQQTKANYAGQKDERETKQAAIEESKKKLEDLKVKIDSVNPGLGLGIAAQGQECFASNSVQFLSWSASVPQNTTATVTIEFPDAGIKYKKQAEEKER